LKINYKEKRREWEKKKERYMKLKREAKARDLF
jgi:hypothetical protein